MADYAVCVFEPYDLFSVFISGLTCKACSLDVLSHEWQRKSTDALNNNLRPKSDCHGTLTAKSYRRYQVPLNCSEEELDEEEENIIIPNESRCTFSTHHTQTKGPSI